MKQATIALALASGLAWTAPALSAEETATPQEIIAKVQEAAALLAETGEAGLATFDTAESPFVWKDSYIFVYDCGADLIVAHPVTSKGQPISSFEDINGVPFGLELCKAAEIPGGSWTEYAWPRPVKEEGADQLAYAETPSRKVSYMLDVEGQPYQVGAGRFDETTSVDDLNALLDE
jgi:signal transduction histidine kinase